MPLGRLPAQKLPHNHGQQKRETEISAMEKKKKKKKDAHKRERNGRNWTPKSIFQSNAKVQGAHIQVIWPQDNQKWKQLTSSWTEVEAERGEMKLMPLSPAGAHQSRQGHPQFAARRGRERDCRSSGGLLSKGLTRRNVNKQLLMGIQDKHTLKGS